MINSSREIAFKKTATSSCPDSYRDISGSLMQVNTGQVCNRQVADLVGVNILWDADMYRHDIRFLAFKEKKILFYF
jgi:hypothetical protein